MEKIAILRWESGHVPQGLMQLEQLPGNSTNLASYPFPVKLVEVKGANTDTVILHPSQKLLEDMIQLAKELEKEGVRAITTSCGFNAIFQEALANAVDIPVFTSSLLQVPFAQALVGRDRAVGVITASASSLSEKHLRACGITDEMHPIVMGLENAPEWSKIFDHPDDSFDMDLVTEEILNVARQGVKDHPEIGAIVLECTDLPPFARRIREELDIPVFDFNSMIGHVAMALSLVKLYEVISKKRSLHRCGGSAFCVSPASQSNMPPGSQAGRSSEKNRGPCFQRTPVFGYGMDGFSLLQTHKQMRIG